MSRAGLPQDYLQDEGTLIEDFESISGWSCISGSQALDTTNYKTGSGSLKLTSESGGHGITTKTISLDLSEKSKRMTFWFYVYDVAAFNYVSVIFSSTTNPSTKNFTCQVSNAGGQIRAGWNKFSVGRANWTNTGDESWNNTMVRLRIQCNAKAGTVNIVSVDSLYGSVESMGRVLLTFDDGYDDVYNEVFSYMQPRGLRGTSFVVGSLIDGAGFMTKAQLTEIYAYGWAIANHTYTHANMAAYTQAQAYAELNNNKNWLISNGYPRAVNHVAYPVGGYNDDVLLAMAQVGAKTGRTTKTGNNYDSSHPYELTIREISNATSLATAQNYVGEAISRGTTVILMLHKLVESPSVSTEWSIINFQGLIDYLVMRKIRVVTIDEWYEGLTNLRYRSLPLYRSVA